MSPMKEEMPAFEKPERLASFVKRLGNPESTALLHSPCHTFHIPQVEGVIGYQQVGKCAVVIGDPLCLPQDSAELTKAFHDHCQKHQLKIVYLLIGHDFAHWTARNGCRTLIQVGEELSVHPTHFQKKRKLRWQLTQAQNQEVAVNEYKDFDPVLEERLQAIMHAWLKQRRGPQVHLGNLPFFNQGDHRIFYAEQRDKIVGLLVLFPLDRFQGWVVRSCLAVLEAPVGTTEQLMCFAIDTLAQENCSFLCLGIVSGSKIGKVMGLNPVSTALTSCILRASRWFFKLDAKALYFKKYHPHSRSTFLVSKEKLSLTELLAIKRVLNVKL